MTPQLPVGPVGTGGDSAARPAAAVHLPAGPVGTGGGAATRTTTPRGTAGGGAFGAARIAPELLRRADHGTKRHLLLLAGEAASRGWSPRIGSWADAAALGDRLYRSKCKRLDDAEGRWERYEIAEVTVIPQEILDAIQKLPLTTVITVAPEPRRKAPKFPAAKKGVMVESAKVARSAIEFLEHSKWWMREMKSGEVRLWWD